MSMTDPVADLLTRIRNGYSSKLDNIDVPASRLKANIVKVLKDEGFLKSFKLIKEEGKARISVQLKYDNNGEAVLRGVRRVSRPGLRKYVRSSEVALVRSGAGIAILSTSKGVMSSSSAKSSRVGGEYLCEVW